MRFLAIVGAVIAALIVLPVGAEVSSVSVTQTCAGSRVSLSFSWYGVSPQSRQMWLDLSQRDNTFAAGTFSSFGPIDPGRNFYSATTSSPARVYIRVNQLLSDGRWDPSPVYYVDPIRCQVTQPGSYPPANQPPDPPCYVNPYDPPPSGPRRGFAPDEDPGPCDVPNVQYNEPN